MPSPIGTLNGASRHHFNGLDNLITLWNDAYFWNALGNMIFYVSSVLAQYAIAFGLALVLPIALPGMVAAFILSIVLCWNEYFFSSLLTGFDAQTLPVMVASQTGSQGINSWSMAALSTAAILPLVLTAYSSSATSSWV